MQNSQVWASAYRHDSTSSANGSDGQLKSPSRQPRSLPPKDFSPPDSVHRISLNRHCPQPDIWSPIVHQGTHPAALRGSSFGAYGALSSFGNTQRVSASPSIDSERYKCGGAAWGSAELPRRRLASFPSAEPGTIGDSPVSSEVSPKHEPFLSTLHSVPLNSSSKQLDFTGPAISILERFSNLGEATRRVELAAAGHSVSPQTSPLPSKSQLWGSSTSLRNASVTSMSSNSIDINSANGSHRGSVSESETASPSFLGSLKVPVPVPVPIPLSSKVTDQDSIEQGVPEAPNASVLAPGTVPVPVPVMPGFVEPDVPSSVANSSYASHATPQKAGVKDSNFMSSPGSQPYPNSTAHSSGTHRGRRKRVESPFLEKLKASPTRFNEIADILGNVVEASSDQHGSRFIQEKLSSTPENVKHLFLEEVASDALALSTDVFGNYVVQLLFEVCSPQDRATLWSKLRGHVLVLTVQMYGCRVVQMALRYLDVESQKEVVSELKASVLRCIKDHNGNHVIQKAVEHVPSEYVGFIYEDMLGQALPLAKHMYGCRVVQRTLEHGSPDTRRELLQTVKDNLDSLVLDQYGNYVVQHIVEFGAQADREFVLQKLIPNVVALSRHKYASNVIEKCFIKSSPTQRSRIVTEIVSTNVDEDPAVLSMMKDQYANYVIQRILGTARDDDYERLARVVRKNLPIVKRSHHGKHLLAIERRLRA